MKDLLCTPPLSYVFLDLPLSPLRLWSCGLFLSFFFYPLRFFFRVFFTIPTFSQVEEISPLSPLFRPLAPTCFSPCGSWQSRLICGLFFFAGSVRLYTGFSLRSLWSDYPLFSFPIFSLVSLLRASSSISDWEIRAWSLSSVFPPLFALGARHPDFPAFSFSLLLLLSPPQRA